MTAHELRSHATWAASSTARHMFCPGSLPLTMSLPAVARVGSEAAAYGTCMHQIAEQCLHEQKLNAWDFIGDEIQIGPYSFTVDEEMANATQVYIDYCRDLMRRPGAVWWIEENFSLATLKTPFDAGGTGDFVCFLPAEKMLEIVDLKGGKGVLVDVHENAQLRSYGLGALLKHQGLDVDRVCTTIVQPRATHKDGTVRSEIFHVADLLEWTGDLLKAMNVTAEAFDALVAAQGNQVLLDEWRDKYLKPGKCQFCPAEGVCPALRNDALSVVNQWFEPDPDTGERDFRNAPLDVSPETLARDLDLMDQVGNWMNARRAYAQQLAESGTEIPGYILVDKRGTRRWLEQDQYKAAGAIAKALQLPADKLFVSKLMSPAQVEKLIPSAAKKKIEQLWEMHVSGTNLVRADKTNRPAVGSVVQRFFETPE